MENKTVSGLGTVFSWSNRMSPGCGMDGSGSAMRQCRALGSRMICAAER